MELQYFVVLSFCVYRISHLLSQEDGPFNFVINFRKLFGKSQLGQLMDCFFCISIWISFILSFIFVKDTIGNILMEGFAISGAAVAIHKLTSKNEPVK